MTREEFIEAGRAVLRVDEGYDIVHKMHFARGSLALLDGVPTSQDDDRNKSMYVAGLVRDWPSDEAERATLMLDKIADELGY